MEKLSGVESCYRGELDVAIVVKERRKLEKENVAMKAKVQLLSLKITEQSKHIRNLDKEINTLGSNIRNYTYGQTSYGNHSEEKFIMAFIEV